MRIVLSPAQKVELNITDYSYLDLPVPALQDSSQVQAATPVEKPTGIAEETKSRR